MTGAHRGTTTAKARLFQGAFAYLSRVKHVKLIGLCLVAVLALGAVVASVAQAEETPEWGHCVKLAKDKGKYKNANCTELEGKTNGKGVFKAKAKGFYEWVGGADTTCYEEPGKKGKYKNNACTELEGKTKKGVFTPEAKGHYEKVAGGPKFTGKGGAGLLKAEIKACYKTEGGDYKVPVKQCEEKEGPHGSEGLYVVGSVEVECATENATGEATGTKSVAAVNVTFRGCKVFGTLACTSTGATEGEIKTQELDGELGYIEKATHKVGVVLHPAHAIEFAQFECGEAIGRHEIEVEVGEGNATEGKFYNQEGKWYPNKEEREEGEPIPSPWTEFGGGDGIISPITPVGQMTSTLTQVYTDRAIGVNGRTVQNVPTKFEG